MSQQGICDFIRDLFYEKRSSVVRCSGKDGADPAGDVVVREKLVSFGLEELFLNEVYLVSLGQVFVHCR